MDEIDIMQRFSAAVRKYSRSFVKREVEQAVAVKHTFPELLEALKAQARAGDEAIAAELAERGEEL